MVVKTRGDQLQTFSENNLDFKINQKMTNLVEPQGEIKSKFFFPNSRVLRKKFGQVIKLFKSFLNMTKSINCSTKSLFNNQNKMETK